MAQRRQISRRQFLVTTGAAGGAAFLAACGATAAPTTSTQSTSQPADSAAGATVVAAATTEPARDAKTLKVNIYVPSEATERTSETPMVANAPRILAQRFEQENPGVKIEWVRFEPGSGSGDTEFAAWLTALVSGGQAPDLVTPAHEIPIQKGWCLPIDDYLAKPNPYAPSYATWKDSFYPSLMKSLQFGDGKTYCAPVTEPYPGVEVGLAYNKEWLDKLGLKPPTTWTEQLDVSKALKEAGSGLGPWPAEAKEGNVWPVALQLLVSMLQDECSTMDVDNDLFVGAEEALPAFRAGTIGPMTADYKTAWQEMKKISGYWIDGWSTADLEALWREGKMGLRTTGAWEFSAQKSDPEIKFERGFLPPPYVTSKDVPGGADPPEFTAGDGKVPADLVTAINGPDTAVMQAASDHGVLDEAIKYLQWITEPENNAFLVNENERGIPAAKDAPLGPLFREIASIKVPKWKYQIAWWGEGLYFDNTQFNEMRKVFVSWATDQIDDAAFFQRQHDETVGGADRYEASLKELQPEE